MRARAGPSARSAHPAQAPRAESAERAAGRAGALRADVQPAAVWPPGHSAAVGAVERPCLAATAAASPSAGRRPPKPLAFPCHIALCGARGAACGVCRPSMLSVATVSLLQDSNRFARLEVSAVGRRQKLGSGALAAQLAAVLHARVMMPRASCAHGELVLRAGTCTWPARATHEQEERLAHMSAAARNLACSCPCMSQALPTLLHALDALRSMPSASPHVSVLSRTISARCDGRRSISAPQHCGCPVPAHARGGIGLEARCFTALSAHDAGH